MFFRMCILIESYLENNIKLTVFRDDRKKKYLTYSTFFDPAKYIYIISRAIIDALHTALLKNTMRSLADYNEIEFFLLYFVISLL